jgi:hypothetical protein
MSVQLHNTAHITNDNGIKCLVYGGAGAGKTVLCSTAPNPVILSAESGLLSLQGFQLPYIEINGYDDLTEAYKWVMGSEEAKQFDTVCLDSLSEIGEVVLASLKPQFKDPRKAYGEMQDQMIGLIRNFRDMPKKNVYFAAKEEETKDGLTGTIKYRPSMPGNKLPPMIPYFFDETFNLCVYKDSEGVEHRALRTRKAEQYEAKDRSGKLDEWELPNLTHVFEKICG